MTILFRIVGKKFSVSGLRQIEQHKRYLIISNYPCFYSSFILMGLFPEAAIVAAAFISRIPVLGHFQKQNGVVFVDKKDPQKTKQAQDKALEGDPLGNVIIFPEGQRSPDGQIHPFKHGFVYILTRTSRNQTGKQRGKVAQQDGTRRCPTQVKDLKTR